MMEQIKGAIRRNIRSFSDYAELTNSKMGRMVPFGFYPQLAFIEIQSDRNF
jgi:hypothetical protein